MPNKAAIPLYINTDMLNNLFTIVIQEFAEIKSVSTKDAIAVHFKTPMSEFSYDIFGKYIQGDLEISYANEFIKQRTEEKISANIVIMKKLRDILSSQGILKEIDTLDNLRSIKENDYIQFTTQLEPNPILKKTTDIIEEYEIQNMLLGKQRDDGNGMGSDFDLINTLKKWSDDCNGQRCKRLLSRHLTDNATIIIVPVKNSSMLDFEDYLLNGKVSIMGKVVKKYNVSDDLEVATDENGKEEYLSKLERQLLSNTLLDKVDFNSIINKFGSRFSSINSKVVSNDIDVLSLNNIIEIIPISIVI